MQRTVVMAGIVGALMGLFGCSKDPCPQPTTSDEFAVGQVWEYKAREGEADSRLVIGRIETLGEAGRVVHIKLINLRVKNPKAPGGFSSLAGHVPMSEEALKESVTRLTEEQADLEGFEEGYEMWLGSYREGGGGVFSIQVKDVVDCMEQAINR
jgi:hypothetical protein